MEQGHQPTLAELFEFFPPADQDRAFMADMANKIQVTQEQIDPATGQPFTGDSPSETLRERLIERVAQKHFGGDYSKVDGNGSGISSQPAFSNWSSGIRSPAGLSLTTMP